MTNETKVKLLQVILDAGMGGTDREMLDNLKAVIKAIESDCNAPKDKLKELGKCALSENIGIIPKRKAGRPKKG